jgi:hypothetical protein
MRGGPQGKEYPVNLRGYVALYLFGTLILACGDGDDSGPTSPEGGYDLSGAWLATITITGGEQMPPGTQYNASMSLNQSGNDVTGNFTLGGSLTGQISGTLNGSEFTFTLTQNAPCPGTFNGSGTVGYPGERITATYTGSDCNGSVEADLVATKATSSGVMAYGLLGVGPDWEDPETDRFWAYARVFNHPDCGNLRAQLVKGETIIPLEEDYWDSNKYFHEGRQDFSFSAGDEYEFNMWDTAATYDGTIVTLPRIAITADTVIAGSVNLEWSDVGADFYDIAFRQYGQNEIHTQTEDTELARSLASLDLDPSYTVYIEVAGFKGFNPLSNPQGNIDSCHGYLFGYSYDEVELDLETMVFSKPSRSTAEPNIDHLILGFLQNQCDAGILNGTSEIEFMFTYASISHFAYGEYEWNDFHGATLATPADALTSVSGALNGEPLLSYSWGGFYHAFWLPDDVYEEYNSGMQIELELSINEGNGSAIIAVPDTFSILSCPATDTVPSSPFGISWRVPSNGEFFFVDVTWEVQSDSVSTSAFYMTEGSSYTISEIPAGVVSATVDVIAVNGANPMKELQPNLELLNGYFYSCRSCRNVLTFGQGPSTNPSDRIHDIRNAAAKTHDKIDSYMIGALAEALPGIRGHERQLIDQVYAFTGSQ